MRAAQLLAARPMSDRIHRQAVNQAQGVLLEADGEWTVVPLVGDHRDRVGPLFVDGAFAATSALAAWARGGDQRMQAIVGASSLIDLRRQPLARLAALPPLPSALMQLAPSTGVRQSW